MGLVVWDFSKMWELSTWGLVPTPITKSSPVIPVSSPYGVASRYQTGEIYLLGKNSDTTPIFWELSADWTTWQGLGPNWNVQSNDFNTGIGGHFGGARIGSTLITVSQRASLLNGQYSFLGWSFAGALLWEYRWDAPWEVSPGSDLGDESSPECINTDGTHIFFTTEGSRVWSFDAVNHNADPVSVVQLLEDPATYYEKPTFSDPGTLLDIDLQGASWDGGSHVYCWGSRDNPNATDQSRIFVFKAPVDAAGAWTRVYEDPDTFSVLQHLTHPSFQGTSASSGPYFYMLNDDFGPYIPRLLTSNPVSGNFAAEFINCGQLLDTLGRPAAISPSALVAVSVDEIPDLTGVFVSSSSSFDP